MPGLDIFHNDAFSLQTLTERINKPVLRPTFLSPYFKEVGVTTTTVSIEEQSGRATLLRVKARGAPPDRHITDPRKLHAFVIPQISKEDRIMADQVQNVRPFGSETELQTVQSVVDRVQSEIALDVETTWEYHRLGAVQGKILDADGVTVVLDIFAAFGLTQVTHNFAFSGALDVRDVIVEGSRKVEDELQGVPFNRMVAIVGRNFFDALIGHADVKASYVTDGNGSQQRDDIRKVGFAYGGWTFYEYPGGLLIRNPDDPDGAKIPFMDPDLGYAFPDVADIFAMYFAPGDFNETVNTLGRPMYSKVAVDEKYNRWTDVYVQSNPLAMCTRPKSVLKLTKS